MNFNLFIVFCVALAISIREVSAGKCKLKRWFGCVYINKEGKQRRVQVKSIIERFLKEINRRKETTKLERQNKQFLNNFLNKQQQMLKWQIAYQQQHQQHPQKFMQQLQELQLEKLKTKQNKEKDNYKHLQQKQNFLVQQQQHYHKIIPQQKRKVQHFSNNRLKQQSQNLQHHKQLQEHKAIDRRKIKEEIIILFKVLEILKEKKKFFGKSI